MAECPGRIRHCRAIIASKVSCSLGTGSSCGRAAASPSVRRSRGKLRPRLHRDPPRSTVSGTGVGRAGNELQARRPGARARVRHRRGRRLARPPRHPSARHRLIGSHARRGATQGGGRRSRAPRHDAAARPRCSGNHVRPGRPVRWGAVQLRGPQLRARSPAPREGAGRSRGPRRTGAGGRDGAVLPMGGRLARVPRQAGGGFSEAAAGRSGADRTRPGRPGLVPDAAAAAARVRAILPPARSHRHRLLPPTALSRAPRGHQTADDPPPRGARSPLARRFASSVGSPTTSC